MIEEKNSNGVDVSLVVPCFNEEEMLVEFYNETIDVLEKTNMSYEILFINDGSKDATLPMIEELAQQCKQIKYISFSRNFGKEAAIYAGLCNSSGELVAVMDADLQDPPELLPKMIRIINDEGYDCVATYRSDRKGEPIIRSNLAKSFYKIINRISDVNIVDGARDYRLMKRKMVNAIIAMSEVNRFSKGIFVWVGFKTFWLDYKNVQRMSGTSKWNISKLFKYAIDGIVDYSQIPLNISSYIGFFITIVSFFMLCVVIIRRIIFGDPVAGWASMVCIMIFLGGIQLFAIGVIGRYIAKIYMEVKDRPHYIIDKTNIQGVKLIN